MKYIFYVLFCLLAIACNDNRGKVIKPLTQVQNGNFNEIILEDEIPVLTCETGQPIVIDVPSKKLYTADKIIESYTFIPLETSEACLIGDIEELCTDNEYIFIFDKDNSKVFQFTDKGKFVRKIGSQGRGPHEYTEVWNIALDKEAKQICLLDLSGRKLLYFDYKGDCVKEEPLYYLFTWLQFDKGKRYIYTGSLYNVKAPRLDFHRLVIADENQRPLYRGFPYTEKIRNNFNYVPQYPIRKFADGIFYNELMSDTIWKVEVDKYKPAYVVNFPKRGELFSAVERENMTDQLYEQKTKLTEMFTQDYLITDQLVYFGIVGEDNLREVYPLLYSKKTGEVLCGSINVPLITSRVGDYYNSIPQFVYQENAFVSVLQPQSMKKILKSLSEKDYNKISLHERQFVESLHEEDNPVLMITKYKDF